MYVYAFGEQDILPQGNYMYTSVRLSNVIFAHVLETFKAYLHTVLHVHVNNHQSVQVPGMGLKVLQCL